MNDCFCDCFLRIFRIFIATNKNFIHNTQHTTNTTTHNTQYTIHNTQQYTIQYNIIVLKFLLEKSLHTTDTSNTTTDENDTNINDTNTNTNANTQEIDVCKEIGSGVCGHRASVYIHLLQQDVARALALVSGYFNFFDLIWFDWLFILFYFSFGFLQFDLISFDMTILFYFLL